MNADFKLLIDTLTCYVGGKLPPREAVRAIDDFVSDDHVYDLTDEAAQAVHELQNQTALYVSDPEIRKEHATYIGDPELRILVSNFLDNVHNMER